MDADGSHGMSLDATWRTIRWENRVFGFILAVIEVNTYLAMRYFGALKKNFGVFWKHLAFDIAFNKLDAACGLQDSSRANTRGKKDRHQLISAPPYGKFENGRWQNNTKQNINNIVAAQGIAPNGAGLYANVTRRTFYAGHVSVNTALRKLQPFR